MKRTIRPLTLWVAAPLIAWATVAFGAEVAPTPTAAAAPGCDAPQMAQLIAHASLSGKKVIDPGCDWAAIAGLEQGYALQAQVLRQLDGRLIPTGYKVSGTSAEARAAMGIPYPVVSILHGRALRPSGRALHLPARSAAALEPDLLVRVSDERINAARSLDELLPYIDQIVPFAEVPLWIAPEALGRSGGLWAAINGASGYGFIGKPVPIPATGRADFIARLRSMTVTMTDAKGRVVGGGVGADILGNPLYSLLELNNELLVRGERLKKGDYVSLGNIGRPVRPQVGDRYTLTYSGLAGGDLSVVAAFR